MRVNFLGMHRRKQGTRRMIGNTINQMVHMHEAKSSNSIQKKTGYYEGDSKYN